LNFYEVIIRKLRWPEPFLTSGCGYYLTTAQRCRSKTEIFLEDLFSSVLSQFKKYHPSGNRKFNNLGIFQSLKLRNLMGKIHRNSLKPNFTPGKGNGTGKSSDRVAGRDAHGCSYSRCYGLKQKK